MSAWPTLTGTKIDITREVVYSTTTQGSDAGFETRISRASTPRVRYHVTVEFMTDGERTALRSLHDTVKGSWGSFTFTDPETAGSVNVRFESDALSFTRICATLWSTEVDLITVL